MADPTYDPAGQIAQSLASQARPRRRPSALADDWPLHLTDDLARALGGDATSWTGDALRLVAKSDAEHRQALRDGIPDLVWAWELWQSMAPTPTAAEFLAELDRAPTPVAGFTCPRCRRTSHHPDDMRNGYCGACHDYTGADDLVARVRAAYARLAAEPGAWVALARLRTLLADVDRADLDEALLRLSRAEDVTLVPESNQKTLTDADRAASIRIGDQDKHLLSIWTGRTVYINDTAEDGQ